jgi:prepilin-type processing-associated H-X9-DG protein
MPQQTGPVKTSGLAIGSLIMGILSGITCFLTALPAIICGIVALVKISKSKGQLKGMGLAITGIALPTIMIPVAAMLLAILMPSLAKVKQIAERTVCMTNMKQLSMSVMIYTEDYDGKFPTADQWSDLLEPYLGDTTNPFTSCPVETGEGFSYAFNQNLDGLTTADVGMDVVLLFESQPGHNLTGGPELLITNRHPASNRDSFGGCNVAFVDGHIEFINAEDIENLKWKPD